MPDPHSLLVEAVGFAIFAALMLIWWLADQGE